ncbi:MAG: NERD domain-containing protein [Alistipes sp.]|jgi:hypothetical protein|nr:NERD domain-containing protein [Alistipes sp.]MBR7097118.1 NERD domain-containing protein [Alistipes sp.]
MNLLVTVAIIILSLYGYIKYRERKLIATVTSLYRGTKSERNLILKLLKLGHKPQAIYHDVYLSTKYGAYTQTDLVLATKVGIFVFEVKDYSGWIFGNGYNEYWTKILAYGAERYRFYNPIKQNERHIEVIKKQLKQFRDIPFYSVIVFYGKCRLKSITNVPKNTYVVYSDEVTSLVSRIVNNNSPAPYKDKYEIVHMFQQGVNNGNNEDVVEEQLYNASQASRHIQQYNNTRNSYFMKYSYRIIRRIIRL